MTPSLWGMQIFSRWISAERKSSRLLPSRVAHYQIYNDIPHPRDWLDPLTVFIRHFSLKLMQRVFGTGTMFTRTRHWLDLVLIHLA